MLILKDIVKDYHTGDTTVKALRNININFRENEFVSILGPSGCGKTTLLNLIGGLDRYTSGDLIINGKSTKTFKDGDWDTYRNHSIGFVFQSYNLIPHQSVLANVELALTLSGVSKKERKERAIAALEQVGLKDHIHKKPNQMSGGQMQRVAIARALINNPDILLADEPTGALDSETSVQVMEILKEISKDKLIIMVTHNPDLAEAYSNRIIRFMDGKVIGDSNPFEPQSSDFFCEKQKAEEEKKKGKKPSMSLSTAFGLSLRNLATKKGRTFLTSFAGSIGIIGIALVIALSTGIQNFVDNIQTDTLMAFPLSIENESVDIESVMNSMTGMTNLNNLDHDRENVYVNGMIAEIVNTFINKATSNNLRTLKKYISDNQEAFDELCNDIQYIYDTPLNVFRVDTDEYIQVSPNTVIDEISGSAESTEMFESFTGTSLTIWDELIGEGEEILENYNLVYGRLPENKNEVVVILDVNNEVNEFVLHGIGLKDQSKFMEEVMGSLGTGSTLEHELEEKYTYEEICNIKYKLVLNYQYMVKDEETGLWQDKSASKPFVRKVIDEQGLDISIVGVIRPQDDNLIAVGTGGVGYTSELMDYALSQTLNSQVVQEQLASPDRDVISGLDFVKLSVNDFDLADIDLNDIDIKYLNLAPFMSLVEGIDITKIDISNINLSSTIGFGSMSELQKKLVEGFLTDDQVIALKQAYIDTVSAQRSYDNTMGILGYQSADTPKAIYFYPKSFDAKDKLKEMFAYYNEQVTADNHPEYSVQPTDAVGALLSSVTLIIDIVTYVLIVFVAISLVVSSIMIGIITYISVLERTKEIGILRAIGASKKDVSSVFNAETFTIGLAAGVLGILTTLLLEIPINILLRHFTGTDAAASLPFGAAVGLILISVLLTFIAGLVPSRMAAKKDPVEALRSE
ncbi:MAG: ABC transporter ATP-binding protein/permease [Ruminococcaceae bacterium]|nr:ABC transporter ATP-binding protein/permease [Oscillospiraceae bacterium]